MADAEFIWKTKVAARLHDPAEKALVLLRDPAGHEGGTSRVLQRMLGLLEIREETVSQDEGSSMAALVFREGLPSAIYRLVRRADWWAASADRPNWPLEKQVRQGSEREAEFAKVSDWAQVNFTDQPVLIHPLTGEFFQLKGKLWDVDYRDVKQRSLDHFGHLLKAVGSAVSTADDWRKILLTLWRFGPELIEAKDHGALGQLWTLLPADTRVPDHSIWDHLDLVSAFAGAFAADPGEAVALLIVSLGPVQSFIAAARKTDDLWAGSHLLSRLTWEAMKPLCEELGPDCVLFPRLRGVPIVDLWLTEEMALPRDLFDACEWRTAAADVNPLFAASLPNRFVALVPAGRADKLAEACRERARQWLLGLGLRVVDRLLEVAGVREPGSPRDETVYAYQQVPEQLKDFPEVHWAAVPFALIKVKNQEKQTDLEVNELHQAMAPFFEGADNEPPGFLGSTAWKLLSRQIKLPDGNAFYEPKPGVLYPAIYELTERLLASAKAARPFDQTLQRGWRCTLTGEAEWLAEEPSHLQIPKGERKQTLWTRIAMRRPAWAREGEHLSALPAIKRLWPTLFAEEIRQSTTKKEEAIERPKDKALTEDTQRDTKAGAARFVVSTHTMSLAHHLREWAEKNLPLDSELKDAMERAAAEPVVLPARLIRLVTDEERRQFARRIAGYLDWARESEDEATYQQARRLVARALGLMRADGRPLPLETYYALLLMDGDRMGAILSGTDERTTISFLESFHPSVRQGFEERFRSQKELMDYGRERRPVSPARHIAISAALNDFSLRIARHIVESEHAGHLIYCGGDDVLAMLPVADALSAAQRLRLAYSGRGETEQELAPHELRQHHKLVCRRGFAYLNGRLMRMMGPGASASCGIVVAHHQAPLTMVLSEVRSAEKRAKDYRRWKDGGWVTRDALQITILKRSGGALRVSVDWDGPLKVLGELREFLADPKVSRRAVFHTLERLEDLPDPDSGLPREEWRAMLESLLAYQLMRQAEKPAKERAADLGKKIAGLVYEQLPPPEAVDHSAASSGPRELRQAQKWRRWLADFLRVAEFLAREVRAGG